MSTTQRVVRKQLAGAEDLLQGVGIVTQTRGSGSYPIHKLDIPIPTYDIAEMQASSAEFMRLYGTDTAYTDYRRNPEGTIGIPSNLGGVWEPMRFSEYLVCGNFTTGAYVFSSDCVVGYNNSFMQWNGVLPKVVAAGSTPTTAGGIGAGAWVDRTDDSLRSEMSIQDITSNVKKIDNVKLDIETAISNTGRASLQYGTSYPVTSPIKLNTMGALLDGGKVNANFQANNSSNSKTKITKSGSGTASVATTTGTATVDCVAYVEYAENTYNGNDYYQTALSIENLGIENLSTSPGSKALHIEQAGGLLLKNVLLDAYSGVALTANDLWSTELDSCIFDGAYIQNAGTSMTLTNCHSVDNDNVIAGAYQWDDVKYSSLINCTADNLTYPVYKMHDCHGVTLVSCGSEKIAVSGTTTGIVFDSSGYNEVTFLEYNHVNNSTDTSPTFAFGEGDNIKMIGGRANLALGTRTNPDIHIKGKDCFVEVHGFIFRDQTIPGLDSIPSVTFDATATNSKVVVYLQSGRICTITKSGITYKTIGHDAKSFLPYLQSGSTNDFTYSVRSGRCVRDGDLIHINGEITLTGNSAQTSQINIGGLPYLSKYKANATFWCNNADVTMSGYLPAGAKNIFLFKTSTATTKTELRPADVTSSATITFAISYVWDTTAPPTF